MAIPLAAAVVLDLPVSRKMQLESFFATEKHSADCH
jgi:hypothetical protein